MKTTTLFIAFAVTVMLIGAAGAATVYDGSASLSNLTVSPNPIMAGGNATIRFQLYNAYDYWLYSTTLQPTGSYPILNVSPLSSRVVGLVVPGYNPKYYNYTIHIPDTVPSGTYTLTFTATYFVYAATGTEIATSSMPVSFYVQNNPNIKITLSSPSPSTLYTGHNQSVDVVIENVGYGTARNVSVALSSGRGLTILSSVKTFFVSNLTYGSSVSEPILISAQGTNYTNLNASVAYYSSSKGQRFNSTQQMNLSVAPSAQFSISSAGTGPVVGAADVPIHLEVTNTGTSPASKLQFNLETSYPITPVASTAFVDELQPGATANLTFLVDVDTNGVPGNYPITLFEQWKQPNGAVNQQFTGSDNYFIPVSSGSSNGSAIEYVAAVIIAAAAVMMLRKMAAKKRSASGHENAKGKK